MITRNRWQFAHWVTFGILIATVMGACVLFVRSSRQAHDDALRTRCSGRIAALTYSLHQYYEKYKSFPPSATTDSRGRPLLSWRVLILEFVEPELFARFNLKESWDSPHNRQLIADIPPCYVCPADHLNASRGYTNYLMVPGIKQPFLPIPRSDSPANRVLRDRFESFLIVESANGAVPWTQPKDISLKELSNAVNDQTSVSVSSHHPGGAYVGQVDGSRWWVVSAAYPDEFLASETK